jgi:glutathione S-transferase
MTRILEPFVPSTPLLFYGVPSGCSFGSIVALEWLGAPYRLCRVEMPEVVSGPGYRRINPIGETPSLMLEDGRVISESMAILGNIGARGIDRGLGFAQQTVEFDRLNHVLAYLNTTFFSAFAPLWHIVEHGSEGARKEALAEYGRGAVGKAHAGLEALLGDAPYLCGSHRSVADAYFAGIARWTDYHPVVKRNAFPRLQRLFERLEADPAVVFAHAIEQGKVAESVGAFLGEVELEHALQWQAHQPPRRAA